MPRKRILPDYICKNCKELFRPTNSTKKFCSLKCNYLCRPHKGKILRCDCGKEFYRSQCFIKKSKKLYCSPRCVNIGQKIGTERKCFVCNKNFWRRKSQEKWRGIGKYCSVKCRGKDMAKKYKGERTEKYKYPKKLSKFKKWVWKVMSDYVRARDKWTCFTCGKYATGSAMHAGHFIPRTKASVMFDETNVHAQCYSCNIWKRGNAGEYSARYIEKYGKKRFDDLIKRSRELHQFTFKELEELYTTYKVKLKELENDH